MIAYEEVIADSMETMLSDGQVMEKLAKLKAKDKTLWQKIKSFINELAAKIRGVYDRLTPDSAEGRYVADMVNAVEKLQDLFAEGLAEASANFQATGAQKNTTEEGGVRMSIREIVGESGTNYGKGVYLDSNKLTSIPETQRKAVVIGLFRQLGGKKWLPMTKTGPQLKSR